MAALYGVKPRGLRRMRFTRDGFCIIARISTMSDRAVFFDPSHRRWWWVKRIGTLLGLLSVLTVSFWLVSLFTVPLLPGFRGITEAIKRGTRLPVHRQARQQFLQKKDRERLLSALRN